MILMLGLWPGFGTRVGLHYRDPGLFVATTPKLPRLSITSIQ